MSVLRFWMTWQARSPTIMEADVKSELRKK